MKNLLNELRTSLIMTFVLAVVLCGVYPVAVLAVAQGVFPDKANGSLVVHNGMVIGSRLIAQAFVAPQYFHPRPSAAGSGYDAAASGGSNLGSTSRKLMETVAQRVAQYRAENDLSGEVPIPVDAVTASGSGLDPHISVRNALLQAPRVAKARGRDAGLVADEVRRHIEGRGLGLFGEPRLNVLELNLALDAIDKGGS